MARCFRVGAPKLLKFVTRHWLGVVVALTAFIAGAVLFAMLGRADV